MDRERSERDEELGAALRELDVPEHRPSFEAELGRMLRSEVAGRRARPVGRRLIPARGWLAAGIAAAVAVLLAGTIWLSGDRGVPVASAAEIKARVSATFAELRTLQAIEISPPRNGRPESRTEIALTAAGDYRLADVGGPFVLAYDAGTGVERTVGDRGFFKVDLESTGLAPGGPDPSPEASLVDWEYGALVRALLAAGDPRVTEVEYRGRPAWQLERELGPVPGGGGEKLYGDRVEVTVDQATAFPVRIVETLDGRTFKELRLEDVVVNEEIPRSAFRPAFTPGRPVIASDHGFRRVGLADVADEVGYQPLVPSELPEGFRLAEVAVAARPGYEVEIKRFGDRPGAAEGARADFLQQATRGSGAPAMRGVVSLSYRRGLDHVVATTRRRTPGQWANPFGGDYLFGSKPEVVTLSRGAFTGARAEVVIAPVVAPQIWGMDDDLVFTVSGDLSRDELVAVAESLG